MKKLLFILLFPICCNAQWIEQNYTFVTVALDPKTAIWGKEDVNPPAYDGTFGLGWRWDGVQLEFTYETFKEISFQSGQVQAGYFFNAGNHWQYGILAGFSGIYREVSWMPQHLHIGLNLTPRLEFHVNNSLFLFSELEARLRGDLDKVIYSGYGGIGVKF